MIMVDYMALSEVGWALLDHAERVAVPYVAGGMKLDGMDCQGLVEYLLEKCGISRNWRGSNDMWRCALKWAGTPEAFAKQFGELPPGAAVFIVLNDGGEPDSYKRTDAELYGGLRGNASHVGLWLGNRTVIHASSSMGRVCASTKFDGARAVPNGGWNMVGLWADVTYSESIERALAASVSAIEKGGSNAAADADRAEGAFGEADCTSETVEGLTIGAPAQTAAHYATVVSDNGSCVKLRKRASRLERTYWHVNPGARVRVERVRGDWSLITAICVDGVQRRAYMMNSYLQM